MTLRIVFSQLWRDMRAQRLRTTLTLFGLGWGTFCVIVMLSFGEGVSRKQYESASNLGERILILWGSRTSLPFEGLPRGRYVPLEEADADVLARRVAAIEAISPEYEVSGSLRGPKGEAACNIAGVRPCFGEMRKIRPEAGGRFLNDRDELDRRRVIILGYQVKQDAFGDAPAIGETVAVNGVPFRVVGVCPKKQQESNYNGPDDRGTWIPSSVARATFGRERPGNVIVSLREGSPGKEIIPEIRAVLAQVHRFDPEDKEVLSVWDVGEMLQMFTTIFLGFKVFLLLIGTLTLAVAAIGVSNTMSMVVEDRTPHIGISMALGARRRWVLGQILIETLCFTALGGGAGVAVASLVVWGAHFLPIQDSVGTPVFSPLLAGVTAGLLGICGILSGIGPARRAAALNPAEALRT
jgi:putative ABC transport system permease protein